MRSHHHDETKQLLQKTIIPNRDTNSLSFKKNKHRQSHTPIPKNTTNGSRLRRATSSSFVIDQNAHIPNFMDNQSARHLSNAMDNQTARHLSNGDCHTSFIHEKLTPNNTESTQWQLEAMRLGRRVVELDHEVKRLKELLQQDNMKHLKRNPSSPSKNERKSLVAAAAAASHKSRALRQYSSVKSSDSSSETKPSSRRFLKGIRNSYSCNNLENLALPSNPTHPRFHLHLSPDCSKLQDANKGFKAVKSAEVQASIDIPPDEHDFRMITSNGQRIYSTTPSGDVESTFDDFLASQRLDELEEERSSDELGAPKTPPLIDQRRNNTTLLPTNLEAGVRLWVGTWNMGARDPFSDEKGIIDERASSFMIKYFIPHGYDLYCIGIQEGVSENVYHAIEAYLNRNSDAIRYFRLPLQNCKFLVPNKGYPADFMFDRVRGRGDGAFMGTKFTGIALYLSASIKEKVCLLRATIHKFNIASGSKGGVAVALRICGSTVAFVNCHLDARNDINRREQIRQLITHLGHTLGYNNFGLCDQFHHVIWMGDLNYRIHTLDADTVLHMLGWGRNKELHDKFDGLSVDREHGIFYNFVEPAKWPTFYPTYKKVEGHIDLDPSDNLWPQRCYRIQYKEPFYRGGQLKSRIPGWCDRILIHSINECHSTLTPEKVPHPTLQDCYIDNYRSINDGLGVNSSDHSPVCGTFILRFPDILNHRDSSTNSNPTPRSSKSASCSSDNSTRLNTHMLTDVLLQSSRNSGRNSGSVGKKPVSTVIRVSKVYLHLCGKKVVPKKIRVVAPLFCEDNGKQCDSIGERPVEKVDRGTSTPSVSANVLIQHYKPLHELSFLLWVRHESIVGQCVVPLRRLSLYNVNEEVRFNLKLTQYGELVKLEDVVVFLTFSVRAQTLS